MKKFFLTQNDTQKYSNEIDDVLSQGMMRNIVGGGFPTSYSQHGKTYAESTRPGDESAEDYTL